MPAIAFFWMAAGLVVYATYKTCIAHQDRIRYWKLMQSLLVSRDDVAPNDVKRTEDGYVEDIVDWLERLPHEVEVTAGAYPPTAYKETLYVPETLLTNPTLLSEVEAQKEVALLTTDNPLVRSRTRYVIRRYGEPLSTMLLYLSLSGLFLQAPALATLAALQVYLLHQAKSIGTQEADALLELADRIPLLSKGFLERYQEGTRVFLSAILSNPVSLAIYGAGAALANLEQTLKTKKERRRKRSRR